MPEAREQALFRAWHRRIARDYSREHLQRHRRLRAHASPGGDVKRESAAVVRELERLSDEELLLLVELLSPAERQVILLRYMMDLETEEVAEILGRSSESVRLLERRAFDSLRARIEALAAARHENEVGPPRREPFVKAWCARTHLLAQHTAAAQRAALEGSRA